MNEKINSVYSNEIKGDINTFGSRKSMGICINTLYDDRIEFSIGYNNAIVDSKKDARIFRDQLTEWINRNAE